ncbi:long-chain acyl-CoA synthetases & [Thelonectria olida]|uniref:Long-chain acyl-CoA synthetases n=1 Tax=Thelonectria olida TaxID=1576542 RepID=A0A9P8VU02_9HYPO|nr:long-chain acyl-CoA synthetases & [Thelonectria olida]
MAYTTGIMPLHQVHKPPFTVEAPGYPKVAGETIPRRHVRYKDGLVNSPAEGVHTVFDIIRRSARLYPNNPAVGYRKLIKLHKETKRIQKNIDGQLKEVDKDWQYFELTPFSFITYKDYEKLVIDLGCGLRQLGLGPNKKLYLFGITRQACPQLPLPLPFLPLRPIESNTYAPPYRSANWISTSHACASQSIPIATAYDTLGAEGVKHSLVQTECEVMYADPQLLPTLTGSPLEASNIKTVIVNQECIFATGSEIDEFRKSHPDIKVITYQELVNLGQEHPVEPVPANGPDLYCVMYTSGSSGVPKGACISHQSLAAAVAGLYSCIDECVSDKECVLGYLPLAHILEMAMENLVFFIGGTIGYGSPRTLSDMSVKNCAGDMRALQPTVMVGVPQVWETLRKGIVSKLETSSLILRTLFWGAVSFKGFMSRNKLPGASALDGLVFGKVRELTGGRLRFTMNGASGISDETKQFVSLVLAPMLAGYGLTETCATGSLGCPLEYTPTAIGPIPGSCEAKLVSIPDLGYDADAEVPQGEIWLKGMPIMMGYFKDPEETGKALTSDGWFKTGDIGEFDANGHLRVIDRVKNLVKMQGGEYIALEKVEAVYRGSQVVANVMVEADYRYTRPIAVIMPNDKVLATKAKDLGVDEHSMHSDRRVRNLVLKELQTTGRRAGLSEMEIVSGVIVTDEEWTPPSGLVTATQKLDRRGIRKRFKKEIEECFKGNA